MDEFLYVWHRQKLGERSAEPKRNRDRESSLVVSCVRESATVVHIYYMFRF